MCTCSDFGQPAEHVVSLAFLIATLGFIHGSWLLIRHSFIDIPNFKVCRLQSITPSLHIYISLNHSVTSGRLGSLFFQLTLPIFCLLSCSVLFLLLAIPKVRVLERMVCLIIFGFLVKMQFWFWCALKVRHYMSLLSSTVEHLWNWAFGGS